MSKLLIKEDIFIMGFFIIYYYLMYLIYILIGAFSSYLSPLLTHSFFFLLR